MAKVVVRVFIGLTIACLWSLAYLSTRAVAQNGSNNFTSVFPDESNFVTSGTNPFWILTPGFHEVLEGQKSGNTSKVDITVSGATHTTADGFSTRVVKEFDYSERPIDRDHG